MPDRQMKPVAGHPAIHSKPEKGPMAAYSLDSKAPSRALPVEERTMSCGVYSILLTNGPGAAAGAVRERTMSTAA